MRFHVAHYRLLALAAVLIAGCSSDRATAPNVQAREIRGPAADLVDLTQTPVRYSQTKFTILWDNIGEFDKTSYLADDFIVPDGEVWTIANIGIVGSVFTGFLTFSLHADAAGQPGALMPNSNVSLQPSVVRNIGVPQLNNLIFTLPTSVRLPAGKYWLAITADPLFQATWTRHDAVVNSSALGSQDGGATWQSRGNDYVFAVFGAFTLTQTITFPSITPNPATVSGSATLGATASSGLAVSYSSLTTNVCTVSGTTVSYDNVGTCTVAADQTGNGSYDAATRATQSVEVAKATQTIVFTSTAPAPAYVKGTYTVAATGGASGKAVAITVGSPSVCTVAGAIVTFVGVGTCTITANQAGNDAYSAAAPVTQSVKVDYGYDGFLGSVKNGDVLNVAKAGQVIALQWRLTDASGVPVTTLSAVNLTVADLNCALGSTGGQVAEQSAGASGLQNLGDGYYQLNWKSPASYAKSCKTIQLDLGEGTGVRVARFAFSK